MNIILNGKTKDVPQKTTLQELVGRSCQNPARVIAELNGVVVKNPQWPGAVLKEGDSLELVNFVGGG